jgi:hypothetical protein
MLRRLALTALVGALCSQGLPASAQTTQTSLGSVRIPQAVVANGQSLPAGTYVLRLSADPVTPVLGQSASGTRWVEFTQGGQVKGKELATVLAPAEARVVAKGGGPASGGSRVQTLKGNDYLRVWINRAGTHYLVHLTPSR